MDPVILKSIGYVLGLLISLGLLGLIVKATLFFGKLEGAVEALQRFAEKATATLDDHGKRLVAVETKLDMDDERRARR